MSPLIEILGWGMIAAGTYATARDGWQPITRIAGRHKHGNAEPRLRQQDRDDVAFQDVEADLDDVEEPAASDVWNGPFVILIGVFWVTGWRLHPVADWVAGACGIPLAIWAVWSWLRSRKKRRKPDFDLAA